VIARAGCCTSLLYRASVFQENARVHTSPSQSAATDPGRAARLLADAERIANSIADEPTKASALSRVAKALAAASS